MRVEKECEKRRRMLRRSAGREGVGVRVEMMCELRKRD